MRYFKKLNSPPLLKIQNKISVDSERNTVMNMQHSMHRKLLKFTNKLVYRHVYLCLTSSRSSTYHNVPWLQN